jgi:hypothetical protein
MSTLTCSQIWQSLLEDHQQPTYLTKLAKEKTWSSCAWRGFFSSFFFFPILWCRSSGNHPQDAFYRLDMKVKKKKNDPSIFLATYWNLYWKSGDPEIFSFEIWLIWAMENPLYRSKSYFSGRNHIFQVEIWLPQNKIKKIIKKKKKKKKTLVLCSVWKVFSNNCGPKTSVPF